jgi:hypothetical protein
VAYDEELAGRIRDLLADERGVVEKKMFGGLAFLVNGHMAVAASGKGGMLARVDPEETGEALARGHARRMEMRGREMDGWIRIAAEGLRTKRELKRWVDGGVAYVRSLPPKR